MRGAWAVCKREFASYFTTPVGYVVVCTFAILAGLGFSLSFVYYCNATQAPATYGFEGVPDLEEVWLSAYLVFCGFLIMLIGPLITMGLLAGERSRGTIELLLTHPLRDRDIIFGKYGAGLGVVAVLMGLVGIHLAIVAHFTEVEPAVLWFGLLAVFLMSAAFLSLGLFVSSVSRSQMTAANLTYACWFIPYILSSFVDSLPEENPAPDAMGPAVRAIVGGAYDLLRGLLGQLSLDAHAEKMAEGIVDPTDIAYYVLVSAFFLFLTFRALESRKWRA